MILTVNLLLLILAFVSLFLAALGVPASRVNLGWLGLALFVLAFIIKA